MVIVFKGLDKEGERNESHSVNRREFNRIYHDASGNMEYRSLRGTA